MRLILTVHLFLTICSVPALLGATEICSANLGATTCSAVTVASNASDKEERNEHDEEVEKGKNVVKKEDDHGDEQEGHSKGEEEHKHGEEHANEGEGHGEDEHGSSSVGPEKGVVEASPEKGFKLSKEAVRQFDLKYVSVGPNKITQIPSNAVVHTGEEKNLYRLRNEFIKRIDFRTLSKDDKSFTVQSDDLKVGDQIVIQGLGFLRIAEITTFDGAPAGHAH